MSTRPVEQTPQAAAAVGMQLPDTLVTYATSRWGADGRAWLGTLPDVLGELAADWRLADLRIAEASNRSLVASCHVAGRRAWVKVEHHPAWDAAADVLEGWGRHDLGPRVLARCDRLRATLLAHAGQALGTACPPTLADSARVGRVLQRAHRHAAPDSVVRRRGDPTLGVEVARQRLAAAACQPFDPALLDIPLPAPRRRPVVCHGDLTARNVCRAPDGRVVLIDPDPRLGPPELDTVQWALRAEHGRRWRAHLAAVAGADLDVALAGVLVPHLARTYLAYLLATGRELPIRLRELARFTHVAV